MTTLALSSASTLNRPNALILSSFSSSDSPNACSPVAKSSSLPAPSRALALNHGRRTIAITSIRTKSKPATAARRRTISCEVALKSDSETSLNEASVSSEGGEDEEMSRAMGKIGARVRVKVPLKVFHVPRVSEVDLTGMEGVLKQYVGLWKGKRISANFPFKVEFRTEIEGRGSVKFFAHLKEEEFEYLD